jgi:hypothetical protein
MKKIYSILLTLFLLCSCVEKIPIGFMSDNIRMREDTLKVVKGLYMVSAIPMIDGSTRPLKFEIQDIKNLNTGEPALDFLKKYSIKLWSTPFNPDTDTTMEIVNTKLYLGEILPIEINPVSGQLAFNAGTNFFKGNNIYGMDVKVSNASSSKVFEKFGIVTLIDRPWEVANNFGEYLHGTKDAETEIGIEVRNPLPADEKEAVNKNTHPRYSIRKITDGDDVKIKFTFLDANDNPFPGAAIAKWSKGANYLNCWFDNSIDTKYLDDGVEINFPTVPFPAFGRSNTAEGGRASVGLSYYTLHPDYYELNEAGKAVIAAAVAANPVEKGGCTAYNLRVKITYQINQPGSWEVKVKFAYASKK